ncbi:pyruvate, water dikinase regulatory protein [Legionella genomosp. 1]|uniref:posphoenolpyruvate synthetase regulatory kinase/phosphorylase PpsR n=1 Tax=Legionella genomosp. 1 TaxID=1093625 RepID=UPI0010553CAF|nr:pyruvate, water dikinase regulatory protein [Legionella genomosp. 1]
MKRYVFMISDGTGITAETLGNSLMTQFENIVFEKQTIPYVDTHEKAEKVVERINNCYKETGVKPLLFMTLVNMEIAKTIRLAEACVFDLFNTFIGPLETELHSKSSYTVGRTHGVANSQSYSNRIEAVDYALMHDDGIKIRDYDKADIILVGVSRSGKTPSCLYMALHFGVLAANYPFTEEDTLHYHLPEILRPYKRKLFGLTIDPERLQHIRTERRPNSQYASAEQCRLEIAEVEAMYKHENIPYLNSTRFSIEEIATKILAAANIKRKF